jgi:hypothetical protein
MLSVEMTVETPPEVPRRERRGGPAAIGADNQGRTANTADASDAATPSSANRGEHRAEGLEFVSEWDSRLT